MMVDLVADKQIFAKISNPSGAFVATWSKFTFNGFSKELNSGPAECLITLDVAFDYNGSDLVEGNDVELVVSDKNSVTGDSDNDFVSARTVYRGYISLIERSIDGFKEIVTVHVLGYYTLLGTDILKSSNYTTLYSNDDTGITTVSGDFQAADIGHIARAIIDNYATDHGSSKFFYGDTDIPDMGVSVKYQFQQKTYREALDILKSMAPVDVYYYISATGRVTFRTKPTSPTFTFVFGRDFTKVLVQKSLEKVRNYLALWNGKTGGDEIYNEYKDDASIALYGRRAERSNNYGLADSGAAAAIGAKFLAENKEPALKVTCTIITSNATSNISTMDIELVGPELVLNGHFNEFTVKSIHAANWSYYLGEDSDAYDTYGSNLVTNPDFTGGDSGWDVGAAWYNAGNAEHVGPSFSIELIEDPNFGSGIGWDGLGSGGWTFGANKAVFVPPYGPGTHHAVIGTVFIVAGSHGSGYSVGAIMDPVTGATFIITAVDGSGAALQVYIGSAGTGYGFTNAPDVAGPLVGLGGTGLVLAVSQDGDLRSNHTTNFNLTAGHQYRLEVGVEQVASLTALWIGIEQPGINEQQLLYAFCGGGGQTMDFTAAYTGAGNVKIISAWYYQEFNITSVSLKENLGAQGNLEQTGIATTPGSDYYLTTVGTFFGHFLDLYINGSFFDEYFDFGGSGSVDQSDTAGSGSYSTWGRNAGEQMVAKQFTPSYDSNVTQIDIRMEKIGTPVDDLRLVMYSDSGGAPGSIMYVSTNTINGNSLSVGSPTVISFAFPGVGVTGGTPYWFVLERTGSLDSSNYYKLGGNTGSGTSTYFMYVTGAWVDISGSGGTFEAVYFQEYAIGNNNITWNTTYSAFPSSSMDLSFRMPNQPEGFAALDSVSVQEITHHPAVHIPPDWYRAEAFGDAYLQHNTGNTGLALQSGVDLVDGYEYRVHVYVGGHVGSVVMHLETSTIFNGVDTGIDGYTIPAGSGTVNFTVTIAGAAKGDIHFTPTSDFDGFIDDVSIKLILGTDQISQRVGSEIEEIEPGDTCRFVGFSSSLDEIFRDNMLITKVVYNLESAEIEVEIIKSGLIDFQTRQGIAISDIGNGGLQIPESYT